MIAGILERHGRHKRNSVRDLPNAVRRVQTITIQKEGNAEGGA